jgi:galactose mutarotase-like enzyme
MELYGRTHTRRQIEARTGRLSQIGGLRRFTLSEGPEAGVEQIEVRTGAGLRYLVSPSRALDISLAELGGVPLSWQSPNGDVHPAYFADHGTEWLTTAVGGLLMTCGLRYVGAPGEDAGEQFGIHGRIHHTPAREVSVNGRWHDDEYDMTISGIAEETALFGDKLRLTRTIRSRLGQNRLTIHDEVENIGFSAAPHMILYHFNFGYPLLDEATEIHLPTQKVVARDKGVPIAGYDRWQAPDAAYTERVYYHELDESETRVTAVVHNPHFPLPGGDKPVSVQLSWSPQQLPRLVQWKMAGAGEHVLGIEPANCWVDGRAAERERGTLQTLAPGETRTYELELEIKIED